MTDVINNNEVLHMTDICDGDMMFFLLLILRVNIYVAAS